MCSKMGSDTISTISSVIYKKKSGKVHPVVGIIFILLLIGLLGVVYVIEQRLPTALSISDEETYPHAFITERAKNSLKSLTDLGARITGGYTNEVLTVKLLKKEIGDILKTANKKKVIDVDVQVASGAFGSFSIGNSFINAYANIQNVIVKIHGKNATHSILVNSHFDTKPIGPGGGDDGINCANMLEILRKLSRSEEDYLYNIIFLFNGSEEQGLQGSEAFITHHIWATSVKVVVNLDAAGAGGKMATLRIGPKRPWLMKYYNKVPYPSGQVLGAEVFETGIVPSDTDFSVFTEIGGIIGYDFGYFKDGYRYHSSYDGFENIPDGSYQQGGENTLVLIRNLAHAPEIALDESELSSDNLVYYDFFGLFMVYYNEITGIIINILTILVLIGITAKNIYDLKIEFTVTFVKYLLTTVVMIILGWILATAFAMVIAILLDSSKQSLSWFHNSWLILGLYAIPVFTILCGSIVVLNYITRKENLTLSAVTLIQGYMITFIWTVVLLLGTFLRLRSVCFVQLLVFFQVLAYIIINVFRLQNSPRKWQAVYIISTILPNMCLMVQALQTIIFFAPVTGRMGSGINTELLICTMSVLYTILITSVYTPLISIVRKPKIILGALTSVFVLFFILAFTPVGFPYRGNSTKSPTPQRYWMHHTSRTLRNERNEIYKSDGGFYICDMDRNAPGYVEKYVSEFANVTSITEDCEKSMFCGLPAGKFRSFGITWIPADKPIIEKGINLTLDAKTSITDVITRFSFIATGIDQMEVYISPKPNTILTKIDLIKEVPHKITDWNGRPVYLIQYTCGKEVVPLTFSIDVEAPTANWKEPLIDIALVGRYLHIDTNVKTEQYSEFVAQFPDWTNVVPWLAVYKSWVY